MVNCITLVYAETTKTLPTWCTVLGIALVPVYLACLGTVLVARCLVSVYLFWTVPNYGGLLNVFDLFFDRDPPETRSNITTVSMIKLTHCETAQDVRNRTMKFAENVINSKSGMKMRSVIKEWKGFRYWQETVVDFEKQVRMFKASNVKDLQAFLGQVSNQQINDERMWEVYIGDSPIENKYPFVFKVHHSVADGYGVRNIIVDCQSNDSSAFRKPLEKRIREMKSFIVNVFNLTVMILCAPLLCISQYLSPKDKNSFRARKLSSKKQISWENVNFQKIKDIQKQTEYSFSEIILTAVSKALDDVLISRGERIPHVTLVFPHRRSRTSRGLENEFVLAPIKLPVSSANRQKDVAKAYRSLENIPSYRMNYFAPRFACFLFPAPIPRWSLESTEFTVLLSNFPGPAKKLVFDGFEMESLSFFVPNITDNNGLGITMMSYNDQYSAACILDEAVAQTPFDSERITQGIAKYIDDTHACLCKGKND